ncbi:MAG TPA: helix-turn-helix transcriptional regulator [Steroidobacteraceae bacterium]|nr:helix-turn-helix transcriptional regulator [Steroidobacteraceae bacterium]
MAKTKDNPKTLKIRRAFGAVLRELREAKELSQEGLAAAAGLDRTWIGILERGENLPTLHTLLLLGRALDIPAHRLVAKVEAALAEGQGRR